jgi:hypothetical protein
MRFLYQETSLVAQITWATYKPGSRHTGIAQRRQNYETIAGSVYDIDGGYNRRNHSWAKHRLFGALCLHPLQSWACGQDTPELLFLGLHAALYRCPLGLHASNVSLQLLAHGLHATLQNVARHFDRQQTYRVSTALRWCSDINPYTRRKSFANTLIHTRDTNSTIALRHLVTG